MLDYIKKTLNEQKKAQKDYYVHDIPLRIVHPFTKDINISLVVGGLEKLIPKELMRNVEVIYVANIKEFNNDSRSFNAMYKNGAIYISPDQDNENDLLDDVIHEIAHSIENEYKDTIYGDGNLEREFLAKRKTLYYLKTLTIILNLIITYTII